MPFYTTVAPPCVQQTLTTLCRRWGFVESRIASSQRESLQWLADTGHISQTSIHFGGVRYAVHAAVVKQLPPRMTYPSVGLYLNAVKGAANHFKAHPRGTVLLNWCTDLHREEWAAAFTKAMLQRINAKGGEPAWRGRRDTPEHQVKLIRDQKRLFDILNFGIRVYSFETPEVRKRFSHLLSKDYP